MALVALDGTPLTVVGGASREQSYTISTAVTTLVDAVNEACIMIGHVFTEDGASHTINTSGSSSLGWRSASATFANAATTVKVGLAAVDTAIGPAARAVNVADVITFDVSKSLTGGGGGITANAWQEHVPDTGSKTIANGDLVAFAVQMTARGGADTATPSMQDSPYGAAAVIPTVTEYTGGTYVAKTSPPNCVITFADGKYGFFYGQSVFSTVTTQTWNSGSATKEYGNFLQLPVPGRVYGLMGGVNIAGDTSLVLYSDPLGTPVAEKTVALDANTIGVASSTRHLVVLFPAPYTFTANQPLAAIIKPTTVTNISTQFKTFNSANHQKGESLGSNCYAINRASGAFAVQNSNRDRFAIGLLVGAFDAGGGTVRDAYVVASL